MRSRRKAREAALQALYQCDTLDAWTEESLDLYFRVFQPEALASGDAAVMENLAFSRALASGVVKFLTFIDAQISKASTRWSLSRMSRVDRNILRLAAFELAFLKDIPVNVSINEAIEIAKRYGTDESHTFINGVLDNVAGVLHADPHLAEAAQAANAAAKKTAAG